MRNPFIIRRSYLSSLEPEDLRSAVRKKVMQPPGLFSWIKPYRGYYRSGKLLIIKQHIQTGLQIKMTGEVNKTGSGVRVNIVYKVTYSPFFFLVPLLVLFIYCLVDAKQIIVNDKEISKFFAGFVVMGVYAFIVMAFSTSILTDMYNARKLLEKELKLTIQDERPV